MTPVRSPTRCARPTARPSRAWKDLASRPSGSRSSVPSVSTPSTSVRTRRMSRQRAASASSFTPASYELGLPQVVEVQDARHAAALVDDHEGGDLAGLHDVEG